MEKDLEHFETALVVGLTSTTTRTKKKRETLYKKYVN